MKLRIRKEGSGLYRIDEIVTTDSLYITWPGYYETTEGAMKEINIVAKNGNYTIGKDINIEKAV